MKLKKPLYLIMVVLLMGMLVTACDESVDLSETEVVETEVVEAEGDTVVVTATVGPEEERQLEEEDPDPSDDPAAGDIVYCADGSPVPPGEWYGGTSFNLEVTDESFISSTILPEGLPPDVIFYTGLDVITENGYQVGFIPGFALGELTTFGVSAGFQGNAVQDVSAARAGENGELLPWTTAATAEIVDGVVVIQIPGREIPGRIEMLRFTFSNGEICQLSGLFGIDKGYVTPQKMRLPTLDAWNVDLQNEQICFPDACISLPVAAGWVQTGDNTGTVTIDGAEVALQFYLSGEGVSEVLNVFTNSGWVPIESGSINSILGTCLVFDLQANGEIYGALGVCDNSESKISGTSVVSLVGQNSLSEVGQENFKQFLDDTINTFRPILYK